MASSKNRQKSNRLHIDKEAVATLSMAKMGLLHPVTGLMDKKSAEAVDATGKIGDRSFPFSFLLAPAGRRNEEVLSAAKPGERLELVCDGEATGELVVKEVFPIDPVQRVQKIYGTADMSHPGVQNTLKRLGKLAVAGEYNVRFDDVRIAMDQVKEAIDQLEAKRVTGMVMAARPLHRAHERVIRQTLESTDLLVIFLTKPYMKDDFPFQLRYDTLDYFVKNYLPSHRVVIVPLENTYIFAGSNEMVLNGIVVKNFGCNRFLVGQNHAGLGLYYEREKVSTIFDNVGDIGLKVETVSEFVYCNKCKTLVTVATCPHGQHHHIHYHSESILELLTEGILPPAVLMRKEISAMILARLKPDRFKNVSKLYYDMMPNSGLIEESGLEEFYVSLMKLYQTTSLN